METLLNPYENSRIMIQGEAFYEDISFEGLQNEDSVDLGDCINGVDKKINFIIRNNSSS